RAGAGRAVGTRADRGGNPALHGLGAGDRKISQEIVGYARHAPVPDGVAHRRRGDRREYGDQHERYHQLDDREAGSPGIHSCSARMPVLTSALWWTVVRQSSDVRWAGVNEERKERGLKGCAKAHEMPGACDTASPNFGATGPCFG